MAEIAHEHGHHPAGHGHAEANWFIKYLWSTDHKVIALQYMFTGMFMAMIAGFMAYVFRMQLAYPGSNVPFFGHVSPGQYNALITNHGSIMVFWVAMPVLLAGFGNFLIPLMCGCDDMVFPRINRLSYQIFLLSALILIASWFVPGGGFGGAWTAYPPLSAVGKYNLTPMGSSMWVTAVALEFVAFLLGGINFIVTAMNARAPGMRAFDTPLAVWMIVVASLLFMASVGPLIAGAVMLLFDQNLGTGFYNPARGGDPILWQHLFWFFGHPEVYVVLLPAMGIVAEIITVFSRKKMFGYKTVIYTVVATGVLSFFVWAHHQFVAGIDPRMANEFTVTTVINSNPIAIIGTLAGITFWFPKIFGRMMNETLGKIHFWGTIIPFNFIFIPMFFLGMNGEHRRIYDYTNFPDLANPWAVSMRITSTVALVVMLLFQFVFLFNFISSMLRGPKAEKNPWKSNTLEWTADSPPPHGNWREMPTVYRGPYEYATPGRDTDYWPQDERG